MGVVFARVTQPCQPSPVPRPDRPAHRPFRGLLSVHSRYGLHTRTVTVCRDRYPKASDTSSPPCLLRSLPAGAVAGWGLHPLESAALSRRTWKTIISCALTLAGPHQSRRISSPSFLIEPPRTIPVGGRRVGLEEVDAADKRAGRPVAGDSLKCRAKCATRFVPLARPICGKALRISGPQQ